MTDDILSRLACLADYEAPAQARLDPGVWAYLHSGAADEHSLHRNQQAFAQLRVLPHAMQDLRDGSTTLTLLGTPLEHPILVAPMAYHRLAHPDGELASAAAAGAMQTGLVVSTLASVALESVAAHAGAPLWFQLYLQEDREHTLALARRAEAAGYRALVLTIDAPITAMRNAEQRAGFRLPGHIVAENLAGLPAPAVRTAPPGTSAVFGSGLAASLPTWRDVAWLAGQVRLPLLVKGVLNPAEARQALDAGAAGIIVSNHGGRILDTVPASIEALPRIAEAVAGRVPLLLDGGIRRGTDVLKALALGAQAVLVGRPFLYGLAVAGPAGAAHVLHLLRTEFEIAMALCGRPTIASIDRSVLWNA